MLGPWLTACGGGGIGDALDSLGTSSKSGSTDGAGVGAMSRAEQADADAVLAIVNAERAKVHVPPVALDAPAARAAYNHAVDMDVRKYFSHVSPAPSGRDPGQRLLAAGVAFKGMGENIAMGTATAAATMAEWMASAGHRENILNGRFTHMGVGVRYGTGAAFWVQDFLTK